MNQKDREQMAHLRFTDAEKQGIVQRLIAAQDSASTPPRRRAALLRRMVTVGIAAALVLAAGVGAVTVYDRLASDSFSALFGTAHTEIIDSIGRPIGVSASDAGYTITAEASLGISTTPASSTRFPVTMASRWGLIPPTCALRSSRPISRAAMAHTAVRGL